MRINGLEIMMTQRITIIMMMTNLTNTVLVALVMSLISNEQFLFFQSVMVN